MRKSVLLLVGIIALYLFTGAIMHAVYGPSFPFLSGEDSWLPDGQGGWVQHGDPSGPPPGEPSVEVPVLARYLPIFIPAVLLILVMFTPVGKVFETPAPKKPEQTGDSSSSDSDADKT
jgi:hypothetical protein